MDGEVATFRSGAIRFHHPSNWRRDTQEAQEGTSVVLQSQGVTFAIVGIYGSEYLPLDLIDQALDSLRGEHPDLEAEDMPSEGDGIGREILFFSLDVLSYCWMRSWTLDRWTAFVLLQTVEPERRWSQPVFEAICRSFEVIEAE